MYKNMQNTKGMVPKLLLQTKFINNLKSLIIKKKKLKNKLVLRKEKIANLNEIKGGDDTDDTLSLWSCKTADKPCRPCHEVSLTNCECCYPPPT